MKKYYLFLLASLILFGGLLTTQTVLAKEGDCQFENCFVPAPTVLFPQNNSVVWQKRPMISGLTWKATIVEVYLDGQLLPNIRQDNHQDYFATFYVTPTYDLKSGEHTVYAYAKSGNGQWYDWSKESKHLVFNAKFTIKSVTLSSGLEAVIPKDNTVVKSPKVGKLDETLEKYFNGGEENIATTSLVETPTATVAVNDKLDDASFIGLDKNISGTVDDESGVTGKISGGVIAQNKPNDNADLQPAAKQDEIKDLIEKQDRTSDYEKRQANNQRFGLGILAVLLLASGIGYYLKRRQNIAEEVIASYEAETPVTAEVVEPSKSPEVLGADDFILETAETKTEVDSNSEVK